MSTTTPPTSPPEITSGSGAARRTATWRIPWGPIVLLAPLVLFGVFGDLLAPHPATGLDPSLAFQPPAVVGGEWSHPLGTDHLGRDVFSRIVVGARVSLIVSIVGVAIAGLIGVVLGLHAGFFGGWLDELIMRIVDMQLAVPPILLAILLAGALGGGITTIVVTVAVAFWPQYARVVRGETLAIMQREHVDLARAAGCGRRRIMSRHVAPNLLGTVAVLGTLQLGAAVGLEAALTFLGLGIQPPESAWGLMISDGRGYMATAWWVPTFPGIAIVVTVLGANLLGDRLRDALDPRTRRG